MSKFSPMLAARTHASFVPSFPLFASPKIDGIRAVVRNGIVYSRSGKPIPNPFVQKSFGHLHGYDGELVVGSATAQNVFRASQAVMSKTGEPDVSYFVFDQWVDNAQSYVDRYTPLVAAEKQGRLGHRVVLVEQTMLYNRSDLDAYEAVCLERGYEGVMLRHPDSPYKFGRSTPGEGALIKVKRFIDGEAEIVGLEEQHDSNGNPNAVLGAFRVRDMVTGVSFSVSAGFSLDEREAFWNMGESLYGQYLRYQHFPVGAKDKPRFPIFSGLRSSLDMEVAHARA